MDLRLESRSMRVGRGIDVNYELILTCDENMARQTFKKTGKRSISEHVELLPDGRCWTQFGARHRRWILTISFAHGLGGPDRRRMGPFDADTGERLSRGCCRKSGRWLMAAARWIT